MVLRTICSHASGTMNGQFPELHTLPRSLPKVPLGRNKTFYWSSAHICSLSSGTQTLPVLAGAHRRRSAPTSCHTATAAEHIKMSCVPSREPRGRATAPNHPSPRTHTTNNRSTGASPSTLLTELYSDVIHFELKRDFRCSYHGKRGTYSGGNSG